MKHNSRYWVRKKGPFITRQRTERALTKGPLKITRDGETTEVDAKTAGRAAEKTIRGTHKEAGRQDYDP